MNVIVNTRFQDWFDQIIDFFCKVDKQIRGSYGFKDLDLAIEFGYQERSKKSPDNNAVSCYHYECSAEVKTENCNLTLNTPSCYLAYARTSTPDDFISINGTKARFYGQCQMPMTPLTGNMFNIWLGSAFSNGLPDVTILEDSVKLDWGEAASKFPEGIIQ